MPTGTKLLAAFAVCLAVVAACESSTEVVPNKRYAGILTGAKEKPTATTSTATGQVLVEVNASGTLSYSVTWTGLTGTVTGAHFHGPADSLTAAGVVINFQALPTGSSNQTITTGTSGAASGNVNVSAGFAVATNVTGDSITKWLDEGKLYVNVHTAANGAGEIRAQLIRNQ